MISEDVQKSSEVFRVSNSVFPTNIIGRFLGKYDHSL